MSGFSDYLESAILGSTLRGAAFSEPATIYVSLYTTDPTDADSGTEVSDSGYARQDAAGGAAIDTGWNAPSGGQTKNAKQIEFPAIVDAEITVTHFALHDALTAGNMLYSAALTSSKTLEVNDVLTFDIEAITVSVD